MKRVLFLLSHLCSGSDALYHVLDQHPKIQGYRGNNVYENTYSLIVLTSNEHKLDNTSAIYMDELLTNNTISDKTIHTKCNYVFVLRDPRDTLNEIVATRNYKPKQALNHYLFRLRRMYSIARKAPDSVLLTFADLEAGNGGDLIADYLRLRDPVVIEGAKGMGLDNIIPAAMLDDATAGFEYWLFQLKSLGLRATSA